MVLGNSRLGALGAMVERMLVRSPLNLPNGISESLTRSFVVAMQLSRHTFAEGAESRTRGILNSSRFGTAGLRLGRDLILRGSNRIELGEQVRLGDRVFISATGAHGHVAIGARTHIDVNAVLYGQGGLYIGEKCAIASGVTIYTQTNRYDVAPLRDIVDQGTAYRRVAIGDDVWIGACAVILPGVTIGDHAVVAAGAVVTKNVDSWQIVGGVPARRLSDRRGVR